MELDLIVKRNKKWMFILIAIGLAVAATVTKYTPFFLGYCLGAVFSLYSTWLLARKIKNVAAKAADGKTARSLGTISRMALAVLATILALKYPDKINVYGVVLGLMTANIVIMIDYFIYNLTQNEEER